jgi:hypothetical protein
MQIDALIPRQLLYLSSKGCATMSFEPMKPAMKPKPEQDPETGRFVTGNVGGGRPKGSRGLLAEIFLDDLYQDWKERGAQAIQTVFETRPADYLKIVAMVVSKCEDLGLDNELRDAAVERFIEERRQQALKMIAKMDEAE